MSDSEQIAADLFRQSAGQLVSTLTRIFGAQYLDLAEECVQDALLRALETWPFRGLPANPRAWLIQTAKNRALDAIRHGKLAGNRTAEIERALYSPTGDPGGPPEIDDQLGMILLCCHPALSPESRIALTLRTVGGFGVREIARAFLLEESAIAQRLVRAKRKLAEDAIEFDLEASLADPAARLPSVLDVLYLLFSEGYAPNAGEHLLRRDISEEAIRLACLVATDPRLAVPEAHALAALMLFQSARDPARTSATGDIRLLRDQDRTLWDHARIARAFTHLERSASGETVSRFHLEAAIAAAHASAPSWQQTGWQSILRLYDQLLALHPTPIVQLNRAVAVAEAVGPAQALAALDSVDKTQLQRYPFYWTICAELHSREGHTDLARQAFETALALPLSEPARRFIQQRLA